MHKKNNNKTKSFIQGLRPFSIIPSKLKKILKKMVTTLQALLIIGQK